MHTGLRGGLSHLKVADGLSRVTIQLSVSQTGFVRIVGLEAHDGENDDGSEDRSRTVSESHNESVSG